MLRFFIYICICVGFRDDFVFAAETDSLSERFSCATVQARGPQSVHVLPDDQLGTLLSQFEFGSPEEREVVKFTLRTWLREQLDDQALRNDQIALAFRALLSSLQGLPLAPGDSVEAREERVRDVLYFVVNFFNTSQLAEASQSREQREAEFELVAREEEETVERFLREEEKTVERILFASRLEQLRNLSFREVKPEALSLLREIATSQNLQLRNEQVRSLDLFLQKLFTTSLLMLAAEAGDLDLVRFLVDLGVDMNLRDIDGFTALIWASLMGHDKVVSLLIKAGAKLDLQNVSGLNALMVASLEGRTEVVRLLLAARAALNLKNHRGWTALIMASYNGLKDVVELLIAAGADPNLTDIYRLTALMWACKFGREDVARILIDAKADLNVQNKYGRTALMLASREGYIKVVRLLIKAGAKLYLQDKEGNTALSLASSRGHTKIVELFEAEMRRLK